MNYKYPFTVRPAAEFPQEPPYYFCNIGLWNNKKVKYKEAAKMLVHSLAQVSQLKANHHVVDIGFGLGGSFFVWRKSYRCGRITGINISKEQVDFAQRLVETHKLDQVLLYRGGWQSINQLRPASVDRIFAVDCAYHFPKFSLFCKAAAQVLTVNGRLAFHWMHFKKSHWLLSLFALIAGIPIRNQKMPLNPAEFFKDTGLKLNAIRDFSEESLGNFMRLEQELSNAPRIPRLAVKLTAKILNRFYRSGHLAYYAICAEKG